MFDFLLYLIISLALFASGLVKAIVYQWKISAQSSVLTNDSCYSNDLFSFFFAQVFERFVNSKFNIFAFINLFFALTGQVILSSLNFFLDGLSSNQKHEANKRFISMIIKDLFIPFFFLTRHFFEYSYSTWFILIFPIPFLLRYLTYLTRSFVDGLSISSKAKDKKFHQKLFSFQIGLFMISYIFFIFFLNYYFYPNKLINKSLNRSKLFRSSLQDSLVSNMSHNSRFRKNLQFFFERITTLKLKRTQKIEERKKLKNQKINLETDSNLNDQDKNNVENLNEKNDHDDIENENNNNDKLTNEASHDTQSLNINFNDSGSFYSEGEINYHKSDEMRNSIFLFLSFQCCVSLFDLLYDIIRHIVFILDFENYGNSAKSIKRNFINDISFEVISIIIELFFFFAHVSYVILNLNSSIPSIHKIAKIHKLVKSKKFFNISSNTSNISNVTLNKASTTSSFSSFPDLTSSIYESNFPTFQGEIFRIAIYTPIFVMRSLILNSFFLATKLITYKKWKKMSDAIKDNLPDADEDDMRREMRCIICRLDMCTCKKKSVKTEGKQNAQKIKRKVKIKKRKNDKNKKLSSSIQSADNINLVNNNDTENQDFDDDNLTNNVINSIFNDDNTKDNLNRNFNHENNIVSNDNSNSANNKKESDNDDEYEYEYVEESSNDQNNVEYIINKGEVKKLPCGHCFHAQCLQNWAQRQMKCPLCQFDMKNILNRSIMIAHQIHPDLFRNNNQPNDQELRHEVAPNMFIPPEFIRNMNDDDINLENRRNDDIVDNNQVQVMRILTRITLILTFVLLVILIALIVSILVDVIDL